MKHKAGDRIKRWLGNRYELGTVLFYDTSRSEYAIAWGAPRQPDRFYKEAELVAEFKYDVGYRVCDANNLISFGTITNRSLDSDGIEFYDIDWDCGKCSTKEDCDIVLSPTSTIRNWSAQSHTTIFSKNRVCSCGAKHTSNPKHHSSWCDLEGT